MANQISRDKKKITVVLSIDQIKRLDGRAAEAGTNRTALISEAVDALLDGGASPSSDSAKLDTVIAKLDSLASAQGELKAQQIAQATVIADAIKNQPIAVQQQLPAPEPAEPDPAPRKGFAARLFGRK